MAPIKRRKFAAFRFALVGFALPYAFVLRPELLFLSPDGGAAGFFAVTVNVLITILGIIPLAASVSGYWFTQLDFWKRTILLAAAMVFFFTHSGSAQIWLQVLAFMVVSAIGLLNWRLKVSALNYREK